MARSNRLVVPDLVRIGAIAVVLFDHLSQRLGWPWGSFFGISPFYWVSIGGVGVSVFLILSGFVLELNYGDKSYRYIDFIKKRLRRIYPTYWLCLGLALVVFALFHGWAQIVQHFTYWPNVILSVTGTYVFAGQWGGPFLDGTWFIGLIISLYFAFPVLSKAAKSSPLKTLAICLAISWLGKYLLGNNSFLPKRSSDWLPINRLFEFCLGIYLSRQRFFPRLLSNSQLISLMAELSFPIFLIHHPLLMVLDRLRQLLPLSLAVSLYLFLTLLISYTIHLTYEVFNKMVVPVSNR